LMIHWVKNHMADVKQRTLWIGIILLVVGLLHIVFFYPFVALNQDWHYYSGPGEIEEADEDQTLKMAGWVYGLEEHGDYVYMVVDWDNGETTAVIAETDQGFDPTYSRVIMVVEYDEDYEQPDAYDKDDYELDDDDKDDMLELAEDMDEATLETAFELQEDAGVTVQKGPGYLGWLGIAVTSLGLIVILYAVFFRDKVCKGKKNEDFCKVM